MSIDVSRRSALKGTFNGIAVAVGIPYLDIFLNTNGTALAATGAKIPTRFGTWFWGLGCNPQRWFPTKEGKDYDIKIELEPIKAYRDKINILGEFSVLLDGKPNVPHRSGAWALRSGHVSASSGSGMPAPTFDVLIGDVIGARSRFRSLDVAVAGGVRNSLSGRGAGNMNPSETSLLTLYSRLFGPGFHDPNSATFTPDPKIMARRSVLSYVADQRKELENKLGAADKHRLEQYLTSVRQLENQLDVQLSKPAPMEACKIPGAIAERQMTTDVESVTETHSMFASLMLMAMACDQTRIFNLLFSDPASSLTHLGSTTTFHQLSHEEPLDAKLGYQPSCTVYINKIMGAWGQFVGMCDAIKEGDGTLLDNMLVFAHSELGFAKYHTIDDIPMMTAGGAGGKLKTGQYISGKGSPISRVGLTLQQVMGLPIDKWGGDSMRTNKTISELIA